MDQILYHNPHTPSCPWYDITEKFGAPNIKWCEETLCQWISEPANTWSNALYIIVAIYFLFQWRKHAFLPLRYAPIGILILGSFSLIHHMSNFYLTQTLDFIGMFICVYNLLLMNIHRLVKLTKVQYISILILLISLSTLAVHVTYVIDIPIQGAVIGLALLIVLTEILCVYRNKGAKNYNSFFISIFFLIIAGCCVAVDINKTWCDPTNHWIQGHALWHIFSAVMFYYIYMHYQLLWNSKKMSQLS